jgi:hypothetical protein
MGMGRELEGLETLCICDDVRDYELMSFSQQQLYRVTVIQFHFW